MDAVAEVEHGHAVGDELLRWGADIITRVVRPHDVVGRLGSDEFAVLLPATATAQGEEIARRILAALAERIGATAGVASATDDVADEDGLHRRADDRLYHAKAAGTGAVAGPSSTY